MDSNNEGKEQTFVDGYTIASQIRAIKPFPEIINFAPSRT
jgi:hypothetical protein